MFKNLLKSTIKIQIYWQCFLNNKSSAISPWSSSYMPKIPGFLTSWRFIFVCFFFFFQTLQNLFCLWQFCAAILIFEFFFFNGNKLFNLISFFFFFWREQDSPRSIFCFFYFLTTEMFWNLGQMFFLFFYYIF